MGVLVHTITVQRTLSHLFNVSPTSSSEHHTIGRYVILIVGMALNNKLMNK